MIDVYKKKSLNRLKRSRGQLSGIIKMIEEDKYCADVITQLLALEGSLKGVTSLVLESHLNTCGKEHLSSKNPVKKEKFIQEVIRACNLSRH